MPCPQNESTEWTRTTTSGPRSAPARSSDGPTTRASPSRSSSTWSTGTGRCRRTIRCLSAAARTACGSAAAGSRTSADTATTSTATASACFRVFDVLDKYGIKPTVAMDKAVAENYPTLIKESPEARRRVHRARRVAAPHHSRRHVGGRRAARTSTTRHRGADQGDGQAADRAGPARRSRSRRAPPTWSRPRASATSATGATTSSRTR